MIVLQVNTHRMTDSDFWYDVIFSRWLPTTSFREKAGFIHFKSD